MRNPEIHFKNGITFSWTGEYAPTFRKASLGIFDQSSSAIQNTKMISQYLLLGVLNSNLIKYQIKNFIDNSVNSDIDVINQILISLKEQSKIDDYVQTIIEKQNQNPRYDYMSNEQKEIDKLVYEMYGLNEDDIKEVETWYARRYPKLARFAEVE